MRVATLSAPAVVIQADLFSLTHASVTVCPITSDCVDAPLFRGSLPGTRSGLKQTSRVMVHKVVPRTVVGDEIGERPDELNAVADGLRRWLGLD